MNVWAVLQFGLAMLAGDPSPKPPPPPTPNVALASWYDQGGIGACGVEAQDGLRFASLFLRCGTPIRFCHNGCVTAVMSDHGPYVTGRAFDLNANLRAAIGCSDLCTVRWGYAR